MQNNKLIAIDMDEVLTETVRGMLKFHNYQFFGKAFHYNDVTSYDFWKIPGYEEAGVERSLQYFIDFFNHPDAMNAPVVKGAKEKLAYFKTLGYRFVIITGRAPNVEEMSRKYIKKYYPDIFEEVYFCSYATEHQKDKNQLCREPGITMIVEDNLQYSIKYAKDGMQVILLDKPRNKNYDPKIHKNITKINTWDEIVL